MKLSNRPLYNYYLKKYAKTLNISHFEGVFMRDSTQKSTEIRESAKIILENITNSVTH